MKLKQEIISLLSHFDDDGNILPNKIVTFKIASTDSFAPSQCKRVDSLIGCMAEGNEYRIEDAPKRPREVWGRSMEIEFICGDVYRIWFARGHVDKLEVYQSAVEQDTFGDYGKSLPAAVHTYFHARPLRDGGVYYDEVKPPLPRGSFPATAIIQLY